MSLFNFDKKRKPVIDERRHVVITKNPYITTCLKPILKQEYAEHREQFENSRTSLSTKHLPEN
ncbi:hypothetical protein BpHYR1_039920 [Brachionus plicatilis]|uniref:Uncharacterized protein n=1 Tax=Brachionus plicatilis TaxID=10195 RepID=A0A3M7QBG4_BRAPC|nr:hypothetical protein BpHYR1_039920 [Brachionus plicatilis]